MNEILNSLWNSLILFDYKNEFKFKRLKNLGTLIQSSNPDYGNFLIDCAMHRKFPLFFKNKWYWSYTKTNSDIEDRIGNFLCYKYKICNLEITIKEYAALAKGFNTIEEAYFFLYNLKNDKIKTLSE